MLDKTFKILSDRFWPEKSLIDQKRLFQLLVTWAAIGILAFVLLFLNLTVNKGNNSIISDIALLSVVIFALVRTLRGKTNWAINLIFSTPLFIYAYFISDFNPHPPVGETLYYSVVFLLLGIVFLLFYSRTDTNIRFYHLGGILILAYQLFKADMLIDSFITIEALIKNPIVIFSGIYFAFYFLRKKHTRIEENLMEELSSAKQGISKVFQDSKFSIAILKAERDEDGNITQVLVDKVNHTFESTFKINLYEVQGQKADYIFNLIFKGKFNLNEIIHFKPNKTTEFHAVKLEKWFNIRLLRPHSNLFYLIMEDTTKVKKQIAELEASQRRYKVLLEAIPDIFFVIDKDGTYEDFVVKESDLFKIEDADIIGRTIYDVGFPDNMANKIYNCIHSSLRNNSIESIEYSLNTPNGTFLYEMRLAKLSSNSVISVARDITKRKTAEFNLEKALVKAEESDRLKSAFLANLSHEIRTPMNVITNFSRILAESEMDYNDKLEITDAIIQNGKQLLNMIDNTIHLSKIETEAVDMQMKFCKVNSLLREVYNQYFPHIPDSKDIKLRLNLNVHNQEFGFITDPQLLNEALSTLVDNAIKYTLQGEIKIGYEMIRNELVKFSVSDTGIGIPDNEYENVFNRFYRLNNNINESTSGSGLGLSIAQHYVEMLGGKLEFKSQQNVGTTFYFTLPFRNGKGFMTLVS